ncbi:MAG: DUF3489 domain-containing protein [Sphingomonas sp.]|nr:DUF3489 domain-containing protein [Sphingomonas sp.]
MQLILLTTACQREDGSLLPAPDNLGNHQGSIRMATTSLIKRGFAEERQGVIAAEAWREEGDDVIGVVITDAGRAVIEPQAMADGDAVTGKGTVEPGASIESTAEPAAAGTRPPTKQAMVLDMLKRASGATLSDIVEATGWLPHTSRAALTGLRKKGHVIVTDKVEGKARYHIGLAA